MSFLNLRLYLLAPTLGGIVAGLLYQLAFAVSLKRIETLIYYCLVSIFLVSLMLYCVPHVNI